MKKKITYITITAALSVAAFFVGKNTVKPEIIQAPVNFETYCQMAESIVDWNTDGHELSLSTVDGYEIYSYRSEDVYGERRSYIPLGDIVDYIAGEDGLQIYTSDGCGYWWEK